MKIWHISCIILIYHCYPFATMYESHLFLLIFLLLRGWAASAPQSVSPWYRSLLHGLHCWDHHLQHHHFVACSEWETALVCQLGHRDQWVWVISIIYNIIQPQGMNMPTKTYSSTRTWSLMGCSQMQGLDPQRPEVLQYNMSRYWIQCVHWHFPKFQVAPMSRTFQEPRFMV